MTSLQGFTDDTGTAVLSWKTSRTQAPGLHTAAITDLLKNGYLFDPASGVTVVDFNIQ